MVDSRVWLIIDFTVCKAEYDIVFKVGHCSIFCRCDFILESREISKHIKYLYFSK